MCCAVDNCHRPRCMARPRRNAGLVCAEAKSAVSRGSFPASACNRGRLWHRGGHNLPSGENGPTAGEGRRRLTAPGPAAIRRAAGSPSHIVLAWLGISCQLPDLEKLGHSPCRRARRCVWGRRLAAWQKAAGDFKLITNCGNRSGFQLPTLRSL
jgi:hypothetical protein